MNSPFITALIKFLSEYNMEMNGQALDWLEHTYGLDNLPPAVLQGYYECVTQSPDNS